jgi:fumarate hydratase subunit beta
MNKIKHIKAPLDDKTVDSLKAGDEILLSGTVLTARDQAHLRLCKLIEEGKERPVDLKGKVVYYCGPAPSRGGIIGSCGPTTSGRMDAFTPQLLKAGLKGMIGKGRRSREVRDAVKRQKAVYFVAPAGAGAYLSEKVQASETVAFEELGTEAVRRLTVKDFPLIVAIDCEGRDIYAKI